MVDAQVVARPESYNRITEILGCKWSLAIFDALQRGINRPGQIERAFPGLTTKVLHRCLNRLEGDGVLTKTIYEELPYRVEYSLTAKGQLLVSLLENAKELAAQWQPAPDSQPVASG